MRYIQLARIRPNKSDIQWAIVDDEDFDRLNTYNWHISVRGYVIRKEYVNGKPKVIFMHHEVLSRVPGLDMDHINRNRLDNRSSNLRNISHALNILNSSRFGHNKSGFRGVFWEKEKSRWVAKVTRNKKQYKRRFVRIEDAIAWRTDMETKMLANIYDS